MLLLFDSISITLPETTEPSTITCPHCGYHLTAPTVDEPSSPVPELLHTNGSASYRQALLIKAQLADVDMGLSRLDHEIEQLSALLTSLSHKRESVRQYSMHHHGFLSAFRRFPPEILAEVFENYGGACYPLTYPPAQVCRLWRGVALATATLWTSLDLRLENAGEARQLQATRRWLSRSGALPLNIRLEPPFYAIPIFKVLPCMKMLTDYANRWRKVDISVPPEPAAMVLRNAHNRLPLLESLEISRSRFEDEPMQTDSIDFFSVAPRLHTLTLGWRLTVTMINMPWAQLTSLKLTGDYTLTECYDLLRDCHNLATCELTLRGPPHVNLSDRPVLLNHNIKELHIRDGSCMEDLLHRLKLPAVSTFTHFECDDARATLYDSITSFFSRSAPLLYSLEIQNSEVCTELDLINILQDCIFLQELSLTHLTAIGVNARLLRRMTHSSGQPSCCLVPKLRSFTVSVEESFNLGALVAMIESRWCNHDHDCGAKNHQSLLKIGEVTLTRSQDGARAEDAMEVGDQEPSWVPLLKQFLVEGFILHTDDFYGEDIPLEAILFGEPESEW